MDDLGLLLYGYSRENAGFLQKSLETLLGRDIILITATGREDETLEAILKGGAGNEFADREIPVMMFLGFSGDEISRVIDSFPRRDNLPRPVFCALTEENLHWTFASLYEHLLDEHRFWKSK